MRELQLGEDWAAYSGAVDAAQQPSKKNTALAAFAVHLEGAVNVWCETAELLPGQTEEHGRILAHEGVWGAFGLHPHNAKVREREPSRHRNDALAQDWSPELERGLRAALAHPKCVALGECGLDFHYNLSPHDVQRAVFRRQCEMAVELRLPLVVHSREAEADTLQILRQIMPTEHHIHVHCFTSSVQMALDLLQAFPANLFIGFTGVCTFKNSGDVQNAVRAVPLDKILVETDAPFMAPAPHRGNKCHSGLAWHTALKICELKGVTPEVGFPQLRENARRMYGV